MWINTFDIVQEPADTETTEPSQYLNVSGEAWLFDNALMIAEINVTGRDGTNFIIFKSGGQDGVTQWLQKNDYQLSWKAIRRTEVPSSDEKIRINLKEGRQI